MKITDKIINQYRVKETNTFKINVPYTGDAIDELEDSGATIISTTKNKGSDKAENPFTIIFNDTSNYAGMKSYLAGSEDDNGRPLKITDKIINQYRVK